MKTMLKKLKSAAATVTALFGGLLHSGYASGRNVAALQKEHVSAELLMNIFQELEHRTAGMQVNRTDIPVLRRRLKRYEDLHKNNSPGAAHALKLLIRQWKKVTRNIKKADTTSAAAAKQAHPADQKILSPMPGVPANDHRTAPAPSAITPSRHGHAVKG